MPYQPKKQTIANCLFIQPALLAVLLLFSATQLFSQAKQTDSLKAVLASGIVNRHYATALAKICERYRVSKPDSALYYSRQVERLPEVKQFFAYKASIYNSCGYAHYFKGAYPQALLSFEKYYTYSALIHDHRNMGFALNNQGNVYIEMGAYNKARDQYQKALPFFAAVKDTVGIAMNYNNIAFISKDLGNYEDALSNYFKALKLYEQKKASAYMATTLTSIGVVLHRKKDYPAAIEFMLKALAIEEKQQLDTKATSLQALAQVYSDMNDAEKALKWNQEALLIYESKNDVRQMALVKADIGALYARMQQYPKALPYLEEAIRLNQNIGNNRSAAQLYIMGATIHIKMQQLEKARTLLDAAAVHLATTQSKEHQKLLYEAERNYFEASGDFKQALHYAKLFSKQQDDVLNEANVAAMSAMQVRYETEKKERQIAVLNKDNALKSLALERDRFQITQNELALAEAQLKIRADNAVLMEQSRHILQQKLDSSEKAESMVALQQTSQIQALELKNRKLELSKKNDLLYFLITLIALGVVLASMLYKRYQQKQKVKLQATILQQKQEATLQILMAEEKERQRIATDLHDGIGQTMTAAWLNLQALGKRMTQAGGEEAVLVNKTSELIGESCTELRQVSHNMIPNALQRKGLVDAVREFTKQLDGSLVSVRLQADESTRKMEASTELILYRVIQECVNNVVKHAGATELDISIVQDFDGLDILVEDNGTGISTGTNIEGVGMQNIRSRIQYLGGTVAWDNTGSGTVVAIHIPDQYA